jgi:hypothetical protein
MTLPLSNTYENKTKNKIKGHNTICKLIFPKRDAEIDTKAFLQPDSLSGRTSAIAQPIHFEASQDEVYQPRKLYDRRRAQCHAAK